jgi:DNA-binding response OmpR family regulator
MTMRRFGVTNENGKKILLVEQDDCLRVLIREYLDANGFEVKDAGTASEALRMASGWGHGGPDLLLAEPKLSDASGSWLAGMLRRDRKELDVVYLIRDELNMETLHGKDIHVQKPFSFLQLHAAIDEAFLASELAEHEPRPAAWAAESG